MIPAVDIWRAAQLMTQCFRRDAASQAAACADDLRAAGEVDGSAMWRLIATAIERLQTLKPAGGEAMH